MKAFIVLIGLMSFSAQAGNLCTRYENDEVKFSALEALSEQINMSLEVICNHPRMLDIEIQPSQIIIQGEVVPQTAIFFHYNEESCKYLVNRQDLTLTSSKCFPTW